MINYNFQKKKIFINIKKFTSLSKFKSLNLKTSALEKYDNKTINNDKMLIDFIFILLFFINNYFLYFIIYLKKKKN